MEKNEIMKVK